MNRRLEEELLQTAFGDASPEEMADLERRVMSDPEAAKALKTYQFMKEGLKDLGDIPQHQLSTERLRHAILEQGLKPKKESSPWFGWLTIATPTAAAAAIALAFLMMNKPNNDAAPTIVGDTNMSATSGRSSDPVELNRTPKPSETVAANTGAKETMPALENNTPRRTIFSNGPRTVVYNGPGRGSYTRPDPELRVTISPIAYGPPAPEMAEPSWEDTDATTRGIRKEDIIVIQPEKDAATGANKATEVGSASNVAIGG